MSACTPHFLLFSESSTAPDDACVWRFVLESLDGCEKITATDIEPNIAQDRAELLAVVRGLEALHQPSRVTLVTKSRYVSRGLERGLSDWRESQWRWERFGRRVPVRNSDLWKRIDHAQEYHDIQCRTWRFDSEHQTVPTAGQASSATQETLAGSGTRVTHHRSTLSGPHFLGERNGVRASLDTTVQQVSRRSSIPAAV